eukprot:CAMPEP_0117687658 /NCGR_PEP_ID=MMETSP0804-20121206/23271_1 /TAXON_ID=1074897 /ORGANISM="Tetraselmis astigmatica, Strain CCMP880" /LENGTH=112 /DNA_ID=CAMNT_0005499773 /DNA_START=289 /DNA_END=629 /DNA_ORIENTATION=+
MPPPDHLDQQEVRASLPSGDSQRGGAGAGSLHFNSITGSQGRALPVPTPAAPPPQQQVGLAGRAELQLKRHPRAALRGKHVGVLLQCHRRAAPHAAPLGGDPRSAALSLCDV